jgi:ribosomal protein S18 acetylase RimI-like enzyme
MVIREADVRDAQAMSAVLEELVAAGLRTTAADVPFALSHYIEHPHRLHCFVAADESGQIVGFQSLKLAHEGNAYGTPTGWGIIGSHVRPSAVRSGVASRLFVATLAGAQEEMLPAIEAYIGEENSAALAYYEAMGFQTHRCLDGVICKALRLT